MSKVSYRVISIDFIHPILQQIGKSNFIRLNLTQKPSRIAEEYFIYDISKLKSINHEFIINDFYNNIKKLSMSIRSIAKQTVYTSISNSDCFQILKKSNKQYLTGNQSKSSNDIQNFFEPKLTLIGCFTINLNDIKRGVNNSLRVEIRSRINDQIIGYANLKVFISNITDNTTSLQKIKKSSNCSIVNVSII